MTVMEGEYDGADRAPTYEAHAAAQHKEAIEHSVVDELGGLLPGEQSAVAQEVHH